MSLHSRLVSESGLMVLAGALTCSIVPACAHAGDDVEIEDLRVPIPHVEIRGEGPIPMVLIPDVGFDWSVFESLMDELSVDYTMYAVTLPGMVGTNGPPLVEGSDWPDRHALRNAVAAVRQVIRDHELAAPVVIGHGVGGHVAAWLASKYPAEARAAISIDGMPYTPMGAPAVPLVGNERRLQVEKRMIAPFRELGQEAWNEHFRGQLFNWVTDAGRALQLADIFLMTDREVVMQYTSEIYFSDLREDLSANERPILFVAPVVPNDVVGLVNLRWQTALGDNPRNCTLFYVSECRHFVMDDDPWALVPAIDDFLHNKTLENTRVGAGGAKVIHPELDE